MMPPTSVASPPGAALVLRCPLPDPLVELPMCEPHDVPQVARRIADNVFGPLPDGIRVAVVSQYESALRCRARTGPSVVAIAQGRVGEAVSASLLTVRLVAAEHTDPQVGAARIVQALRRSSSTGTEVAVLSLPSGPAAMRLRVRTLRVLTIAGDVTMPLGMLEVFIPLPGRPVMIAANMVCPTPDDLPRHTALAGAVVAGTRVEEEAGRVI